MATVKITDAVMRVAVVDDDESTRLCLKDVLESAEHFSFAGGFSNAADALTEIPLLEPDLTLIDISLPDLNGVECTKRLKHAMPRLKIVIVTGTPEANWAGASFHAGAIAYLVKPVAPDQLLATLRFAATNENETAREFPEMRNEAFLKRHATANLRLGPREIDVLKGLAEGLLYKEISEKLGISYTTVHKYQHSVFKKLNVTNRSEAIRVWHENIRA